MGLRIRARGKAQTAAMPGWHREDLQHRHGREDAAP